MDDLELIHSLTELGEPVGYSATELRKLMQKGEWPFGSGPWSLAEATRIRVWLRTTRPKFLLADSGLLAPFGPPPLLVLHDEVEPYLPTPIPTTPGYWMSREPSQAFYVISRAIYKEMIAGMAAYMSNFEGYRVVHVETPPAEEPHVVL